MHRDESTWSANITLWGAWGQGMGYTFDWLIRAPPQFQPRRRRIQRGDPWFMLVDLELPPSKDRDVAVSLHIASITGTLWSTAVEAELFAKADLVIYYADISQYHLDRNQLARRDLDRWLEGRDPIVMVQLDRPFEWTTFEYQDPDGTKRVEQPPVMLTADQLRTELSLGDWPVVETCAYHQQIRPLFTVALEQLLAARDRLPRREPYER